jgi:hypothetical protein
MSDAIVIECNEMAANTQFPPSTNGRIQEANASRSPVPAPSTNGQNHGAPRGVAPTERDGHGRFVKGNKGGPGNPFARQIARLRSVLCQTVTEEDMREITVKLVAKAKGGDLTATTVLLAYCIGRPTAPADPDAVDIHEWKLLQNSPVSAAAFDAVVNRLKPDVACQLVQLVWPVLTAKFQNDVVAMARGCEVGAALPAPNRDASCGSP